MEGIQDSTAATPREVQMCSIEEECRSEVKYLLQKLTSWREESNRQFSNIIDSHTRSMSAHTRKINAGTGIDNLAEEVCDLRIKFSIISKERNDLLEKVDMLSGENRQLKGLNHSEQPSPDLEDGKGHEEDTDDIETKCEPLDDKVTDGCEVKNHQRGNLMPEPDGISSSESQSNKAAFVHHNIRSDMLEDQDKEHLRDTGKTAIGDINPVLKYTKNENLDKHKTTKKELALSNQIEGWINVENVKSEEVNNDGNDDNDEVMARVEGDIAAWRHETGVASLGEGHQQICQTCKKIFKNKRCLNRHRREKHSGQAEVHSCPECGKTFNRKSNLKGHQECVHQGKAKVHSCPECGKTFNRKFNLKGHQESVHQGKRRKKLPCQLCDRLFTTRSCLNQHIKKVHLSANDVGVKSTAATNGTNGSTDGDKKDSNGTTNDISHMVKKRKKSDPAEGGAEAKKTKEAENGAAASATSA